MEVKRLFDFLTDRVQKHPNLPFISSKVNKQWKTYTFAETQEISNRVSQLLINLGLQKNDKIAIISTNRTEWNFTDMGSMQIGVIGVPMYPTIAEKDYEFIFNDAGIKYAFVGDETVLNKVRPLMGRVSTLRDIYTFDKITGANHFWDALPAPQAVNASEIARRKQKISEDDLGHYRLHIGHYRQPQRRDADA
jgi:Long-chain acyl-CoA synthetases (AMP-forming)